MAANTTLIPSHNGSVLAGDCVNGTITPSDASATYTDGANKAHPVFLYVNSPGGNVAVEFPSGNQFTFVSYTGWLPVKVMKVLQTGTSATSIGAFL